MEKHKAVRVEDMSHKEWLDYFRKEYIERPSIIWQRLVTWKKEKPTLREAAMEAETLLTNYLAYEKFPKGSDCEEVRDMLRRALHHREKPQYEVKTESGIPGFLVIENEGAPKDEVYFFPKGVMDAINNGNAKVLKL